MIFVRPRKYRWAAPPAFHLIVLAWLISPAPSNDREWGPVARLADADPEFSDEIRAGLPFPAGWAGAAIREQTNAKQ